jgi:hypothetical protein
VSYAVYDPRGVRDANSPQLAERPKKLAGLRAGVLDNGKEQADVLLARAAQLLKEDGVSAQFDSKPSFSRVAPDDVLDRLSNYDIAITGLGG